LTTTFKRHTIETTIYKKDIINSKENVFVVNGDQVDDDLSAFLEKHNMNAGSDLLNDIDIKDLLNGREVEIN
jgi:hypothetical protein